MPNKLEGGCLCGAVRNSATTDPQMVADCYCSDCRKSSGTSHGTHVVLPVAGVTVEGKLTSFDKPADSGHVVSRAFCPVCGSAIYSTNSAMDGMTFIRASSLDDPNMISPSLTVYAGSAPDWASIDESKPVFEKMPPMPG